MLLEYKILYDPDTKKGTITFTQDGEEWSTTPIKNMFTTANRGISHVTNEEGTRIIAAVSDGPVIYSFNMTGDEDV
jgi:hypothetical protein